MFKGVKNIRWIYKGSNKINTKAMINRNVCVIILPKKLDYVIKGIGSLNYYVLLTNVIWCLEVCTYIVIYKHIKPDQVPKFGMSSLNTTGKCWCQFSI